MTATPSLVERFRASLAGEGGPGPGDKVVVALSGGLDSCVLLHLLRFAAPAHLDVVVAHYDHGIRRGSAADALWVRGLCEAWSVPLRTERSGEAAGSEDAAREARYDFLERIRREVSASSVLVGHHADDQAETVLFRVLRGTGISGLAAIPRSRDPAIFRPLLGFWREELEVYARRVHLAWRHDPSNDELDYARNALRHRLLPDAVDISAEAERLRGELTECESNLTRVGKLVANPNFRAKAKPEVVETEEERLKSLEERQQRLNEILEQLEG